MWQWALLAAVAVLSVTWLFLGAARILRRRRAGSTSLPERVPAPHWQRVAGVVATLAAVLIVASVVLITAVPGLVDSGFLGWLELPLAARLVLHIPLALAVLGGCSLVLVTAGWVGHWWSRTVLLQYAALTVTVIALVGQLAAWRLIGWGMT